MRTHMLSEQGLPPKPQDPQGRHVSWVLVTSEGGIAYQGEYIVVDDAFMARQISQYRQLTEGGYTAPILAEHDPTVTRGERLGDVLQLTQAAVGGVQSLVAAVAWADPDAPSKIQNGSLKYVSPGFKSISDDRGIQYDFVLAEISVVAAPHQKRLGATHVLAGEEDTMAYNAAEETPSDAPSQEERMSAMENRIAEMGAALAEIKSLMESKDDEAEVEEDQVEDAAMSELRALRQELEAEKLRARRAEFDRQYPVGASVALSEDLRDHMFALSESSPDAFGELAKRAQTPADAPAVPRRSEIVQWGVALGEQGTSEPEDDNALMTRLLSEHGNSADALRAFKGIRGGAQ